MPEYVYDLPFDQWDNQYPNWSTVPKTTTYLNNYFVQIGENLTQTGEPVSSNSHSDFTHDFSDGNEWRYRYHESGLAWDRFVYRADFDNYAWFCQTTEYRHAVLISDMRDGGNREILELFETERYKLVNVLWWSNLVGGGEAPTINRFVSVTTPGDDYGFHEWNFARDCTDCFGFFNDADPLFGIGSVSLAGGYNTVLPAGHRTADLGVIDVLFRFLGGAPIQGEWTSRTCHNSLLGRYLPVYG